MEKTGDRYQILKLLGSGTTAQVFLVWDGLLCRKAVIKAGQEKTLLLQEAKYLSMLAGPYFPALYDYWEEGPGSMLLLEYIEGENLKQRLNRIGRYTEDEVLRIACMVAEAVDGIHHGRIPCLYGDIKPENIMMQKDGRIRLVDFGTVCPLAGEVGGRQQSARKEIKRGGTPLYAAPDMWQGKPDIRSDVYALGRLMQTLLDADTGRTVSSEMERLIERCIPRQREKRYQNMGEFLKDAAAVWKR
ncbi:MAG: serine/threonine protein kinase [Lachnospiraceae bacterium]